MDTCYHQTMAVVYLALGSNVGDSKRHLALAEELLQEVVSCAVSAPLYASKAAGYTDQADFLNTVISGQTELTPLELLKFIKVVESKVGRTATFRWGPREIDIDIILYDDFVLDGPDLTIPHPRFAERDFVLKPLSDLCADLIDPRSKQPIQALLEALPAAERSIF